MKKTAHLIKIGVILVSLVIISVLVLSSIAFAQTTPSISFTLGKKGQSGCLVCHGDKNLVKITPEGKQSLYISQDIINKSVHKNVACVGCHIGFTSEPHKNVAETFKREAGLACKNCHQDVLKKYAENIHGQLALADDPRKGATCGDCHGSHNMKKAKSKEYRKTARQNCGSDDCHNKGEAHEERFWDNYEDHYHGRAYKLGEFDAPPCWDCHGAHEITGIKDPNSPVSEKNVGKRCGECHHHEIEDPNMDDTILSYKEMIHESQRLQEENFLMNYILQGIEFIKSIPSRIRDLF